MNRGKLAELVDGVKGSWITIHSALAEAYILGMEDERKKHMYPSCHAPYDCMVCETKEKS